MLYLIDMNDSMESEKIKLGKWGEDQAANFLMGKGGKILEKNVRTPYGEIDLIAEFNGDLVFVEVKTRSSSIYGNPEEAVTAGKLSHMIDSAESYLQEHPEISADWQIDVVAVLMLENTDLEISHFENVVP